MRNLTGMAAGLIVIVGFLMAGGSDFEEAKAGEFRYCLLYTSPSPRDGLLSRMPSSA